MPASPIIVTDQFTARSYTFLGMQVRMLVSCVNTGSYEIFELVGSAGSGLPLHRNSWSETFYVLKGEVEFGFGEEITWGQAGSMIHFPAGMTHGYYLGRAGATMLCVISDSSAGSLFTDWDSHSALGEFDLNKLSEIGARHGFSVMG